MKNKLFNLFLVLIMLISFTGCGKKQEETNKEPENPSVVEEPNTSDALLWEVKSDTATIYLAGSIHVADEDTYPLQQKLLDAFAASDALAVEVDIVAMQKDTELMTAVSSLMLYMDGTDLRDHVSEETLKLLDEYVGKYGISGLGSEYIETLYLYKPWVLESLISSDLITEAGFKSDLGIDMYFLNQASEKGMEIIEVESAMFQYNMMDSFSPELQEYLLAAALTSEKETSIKELTDMLDIWESGDPDALDAFLNSEEGDDFSPSELKLMEEYNKAMLTDRNIVMADKVEELLKGDKDVFYMVGSAHMIGEDGIVKLLQDRGYTVTKK